MKTKTRRRIVEEIVFLLGKASDKGISYFLSTKNESDKKVIIRVSNHPRNVGGYINNETEIISFISNNLVTGSPCNIPNAEKHNEFIINEANAKIAVSSILSAFGISENVKYDDLLTPGLFIKKIENKEAKVLTLESAKKLKGKRIAWMYFGYRLNSLIVNEMIVGDIVSSLDYYEGEACDGYKSRADYWRSYMSEDQLQKERETLFLLDASGKDSYIRCHSEWKRFYEEPTFTCSDADREVYYILVG